MAKKRPHNNQLDNNPATPAAAPPHHGTAPGAEFRITFKSLLTSLLLALATAGLLALAYPPLRWTWAAHLALAPLLLMAARAPNKKVVFLASMVAGLIFYAAELHWFVMVTWPAYVGVLLFMMIFWPAFALLMQWSLRRTGWPMVVLAPVFWVGLEFLRAHLMTGFPWLMLGQAQAPSLWLIQVTDLTGVYGLSALSAATAGLLADLLTRPLYLRYGERVRLSRSVKISAAALAALWLATAGYGLWRLQPRPLEPGPLVITVQPSAPQDVRMVAQAEGGDPAYDDVKSLTLAALKEFPKADLVVWPETIVPGAMNPSYLEADFSQARTSPENIARAQQQQRRARDRWREIHGLLQGTPAAILIGCVSVEYTYRGVDEYNTALLFTSADREFRPAARYDKIHLVPFGEFVPFRDSWPWLYKVLKGFTPYDFDYNLTCGADYVRMPLAGRKFTVPICFEDAFATVCRDLVYQDGIKTSDFLVNISNDGWFHGTVELEQHWDLSVFRAVENRVPVVRSVNTGISGFIDSSGRPISRVNVGGQVRSVKGYQAWQLSLDPRRSFYGRFGDVFAWALSLAAAAIMIQSVRRKRAAA